MKRLIAPTVTGLGLIVLLSGCVAAIGNREGRPHQGGATLGQELIDLQKAKNEGVLNDAEYQEQRARLLEHK